MYEYENTPGGIASGLGGGSAANNPRRQALEQSFQRLLAAGAEHNRHVVSLQENIRARQRAVD